MTHVDAMLGVGAAMASCLAGGMVITLSGDLGAGKTTLVRGLLRGLGWAGPVKSPTYTLVEHYALSSLYCYHFDFYRLDDPHEWENAGFADYFSPAAACLVEWPERAQGYLPTPDLALELAYACRDSNARDLQLRAYSVAGERCLNAALAAPS